MNIKSFRTRIKIISVFIFLGASILVVRLFFVQIIHNNFYSEKADKQYITPASDIFDRGVIFFSQKDGSMGSAATVMTGYKIAISPKNIIDPEVLYNSLSKIIELDYDNFMVKVSKKNDPYEEIANRLTKETADQIAALHFPEVSIFKEKWRFYPGGSLASHTIGFLAFKENDLMGQYGLERFYNKTLAKQKDDFYVNFFAEVFSNLRDTFSESKTGDIVATIEQTTQQVLESELKNTMEKWNADQIGGIIMDPITGEIYAISAMPDFNLNEFGKISDVKYYRNPFVEDVIEFGSVIKPLVVAGALDQGVLTPETTYTDNGFVVVDKKTINNFDKKGRGPNTTMQTVLDQSLNTGMVFVQSKMGHDTFRSYMKNYGIGEKTGIDLPNETSGLIKNLESPRNIEYANAAFGQGISMTPIEAVRAFSSLANGGNLIVPHLVKEIKYEDGTSKKIFLEPTRTGLIKKETGDTITRMLIHVFDSYGEGSYKFDHYSIASKTGTAQVPMENGKGYYDDRHNHSFFGYFPAYDPKFIVFLYMKNPKQVNYASQTLIPPFVNITKFLINYYSIAPDR
ncbi:MAG: penicillin-binding protein 2 [Desulfobacterales bacterium]|nr:penicillin-binding protein 2 [Desulfobacterales bacterium]